MNMHLTAVADPDMLPEYPIESSIRLDSHNFVTWEFRRYLNSEMRWNADHMTKSIWFELVQISHEQTPVGTLPLNHDRLARMVQPNIDPVTFKALVERPFGALYGWYEVVCDDGTVRLAHETVTRVVLEALTRKEMNDARTDSASTKRRLERLAVTLSALAPKIALDPSKVLWIDTNIREGMDREGNKRRTVEQLHAAISACLELAATGFFNKSKGD